VSRRRTSVGSIFWGLTLVAVGGLLLARNLGYSLPIWGAIAKYWPVLIILWGLLKLIDYFRLRGDLEKRPLFSGGEVAILICVLFVGSAITAAANISPGIGEFFNFPTDFDFWDITGNNYQYAEHQELQATSGATIRIFNLYGFVDVKPSDGDRIVLDVEKVVRAATKEEADRLAQEFTFSIRNEGSNYRVASSRDENTVNVGIRIGNERQRFKSSMTIRVPRKSLLEVTNKYGTVSVEGLEGNQTISNKYGSTSIQDITGGLTVTTGYGSAVIGNVSGDVNVTNAYASTTLRTMGAKVTVENKYGSVDVQDVKGDASIDNRYSVINAQRIAGSLTIRGRNNSVDVDDVNGAVDVETSYKNLSVRNTKGEITLANRHGSIDLELDDPVLRKEIRINATYSDVSIELPATASFSFEGRTRYGDIDSEFDGFTVNSSGRERSIRGQQGGGDTRITVETTHGSIRLEKRG